MHVNKILFVTLIEVLHALAIPHQTRGESHICPAPLYGNPQCCAVDVLDVAALDCVVPKQAPESSDEFIDLCVEQGGREALCCAVPIVSSFQRSTYFDYYEWISNIL